MDLKNWFLTLCFLSIETKTNKHSFSCRFIIFLSHWRESTANITISVEKMELILKFHRLLHHFWGSEGARRVGTLHLLAETSAVAVEGGHLQQSTRQSASAIANRHWKESIEKNFTKDPNRNKILCLNIASFCQSTNRKSTQQVTCVCNPHIAAERKTWKGNTICQINRF